jgi:diguanylate cyclase (GGDEF)-like protein
VKGGPRSDRPWNLRVMEFAVVVPLVVWLAFSIVRSPTEFLDWHLLVWIAAITIVDLLPVKGNSDTSFSLSFPIELSAALIFPPAVVAMITLLGAADVREFRREVPPLKAVYNRSQVAWSVAFESFVFHLITTIDVEWSDVSQALTLVAAVLAAALAGYVVNVLIVAIYSRLQASDPLLQIIREMHVGVYGEFVVSYTGLALFSVLVAIATNAIGLWALLVFIAPLAFARQMFTRTHSLQEATEELAEKQRENEYQALHDALTGLPNRVLFQHGLNQAIDDAQASGGSVGVMLMDLDHFKEINDTLGHHFGDQLLKEIGPRLSTVLREHDMMARLGGDEFGVLLPDLPDEEVAVRIAERLMEELERPVTVEGLALDVSGSIGIAIFPRQSRDAESLLRRADVAMYAAKEAGGGYEVYEQAMDQHNPARLTLVSQVRPAIENGELVVYYQPKVRLSDGRLSGAEALIRWEHPEHGLVMPDTFVPLVERTVLLRPMTHFVIERTLNDWRGWADDGIRIPVAVNISPRSLLDRQLPSVIAEMLGRLEVPASFVELELTESFMMGDSGRSNAVLDALSEVGVGLSIDDFGTGYSSLAHLKQVPIHEIKVDRSFVSQMNTNSNDYMIVRATIELGKNLGLRVVAEGVEDLETFDRLADLGCDEAQGYYIARPMSHEDFTRWLSVRSPEAIVHEEATPPASRLHVV